MGHCTDQPAILKNGTSRPPLDNAAGAGNQLLICYPDKQILRSCSFHYPHQLNIEAFYLIAGYIG